MTLRMADSIVPADLPAGMDAYAGYDNGFWPDYQAVVAAHPGSYLLDFTVFLTDVGTGGDFEPGDMNPDVVVSYVNERHAGGIERPVVYASIGGYMPDIIANLNAAGIPRASYRLLSAHYGAGSHICGPSTCNLGGGIQCDGTQWTDHADDGSGLGNWDESLLSDDFFGAPAPPAPPPPDKPTEDLMAGVSESVTTADAKRHRASILWPGFPCHSWLDDGSGKWQFENIAQKAGLAGVQFAGNQVPTCEEVDDGAYLVISAQVAEAGVSYEFFQAAGTATWDYALLVTT